MLIHINSVNDRPFIENFTVNGAEDVVLQFDSLDFQTHFFDVDNDTLAKISICQLPGNGTLKLHANQVIVNQEISSTNLSFLTFSPPKDWSGITNFCW